MVMLSVKKHVQHANSRFKNAYLVNSTDSMDGEHSGRGTKMVKKMKYLTIPLV